MICLSPFQVTAFQRFQKHLSGGNVCCKRHTVNITEAYHLIDIRLMPARIHWITEKNDQIDLIRRMKKIVVSPRATCPAWVATQ